MSCILVHLIAFNRSSSLRCYKQRYYAIVGPNPTSPTNSAEKGLKESERKENRGKGDWEEGGKYRDVMELEE